MKNFTKVKMVAAAILVSAAATAAYALPNYGFETVYYATADKQIQVGTDDYMCGSEIYHSGTRTPYKTTIITIPDCNWRDYPTEYF